MEADGSGERDAVLPGEATGTPEVRAEVTVDESRKFLFNGGTRTL